MPGALMGSLVWVEVTFVMARQPRNGCVWWVVLGDGVWLNLVAGAVETDCIQAGGYCVLAVELPVCTVGCYV